MPSLAEMLGYIVQPLGGPTIPILPKAQSNATAGSIPAVPGPKGQPLSSPAELMNALTAIGNARYENELRQAKAEEARRTADLYKSVIGLSEYTPTMGGGGGAASPAAAPAPFSLSGSDVGGMALPMSSERGRAGWGPLADPAIAEMKAAGASDAFIQAAMGHGLAEGGFNAPWVKSGGDENSFGHWQLNAKGELPAYLAWVQEQGDPKDTRLQARYLTAEMEKRRPGITKTNDAGAAMDAIASDFERYKGHGPGQRRGYLADAQRAMFGGALEQRMAIPLGPGQLPEGALPGVPNFAGLMAGNQGLAYAPAGGGGTLTRDAGGGLLRDGLPPDAVIGGHGAWQTGSSPNIPAPLAAALENVSRPAGRGGIAPVGAPMTVAQAGAPMSLAPGMPMVPQPPVSGVPRYSPQDIAKARQIEILYPKFGLGVPTWAKEASEMGPGGSKSLEYIAARKTTEAWATVAPELFTQTQLKQLQAGLDISRDEKKAVLDRATNAQKARLEAELENRAKGLAFDETGAAVPVPGFNEVTAGTRGAIAGAEEAAKNPALQAREKFNADLSRESKRLEQIGAANLDLVPTIIEMPDGSQVERMLPRSTVVGQVSPQAVGAIAPAGGVVAGGPQPTAVAPGPTMIPGGGVIGGKPIGVGPPAEGYRTIVTPGGIRQEQIPGSPQTRAGMSQQGGAQQTADIATQEIKRAIDLSDGWSTGLLGQAFEGIGGTKSRNLRAKLDTVKAITGFEELAKMRASSPSGGALGPVSDVENRLLQSTKGSLDQSQDDVELVYNLKRLHGIFQDVVHGAPADLEKAVRDGTVSKMQYDQVIARRNKLVDDGSMLKPIDPDTMAEARAAIQRTNNREAVVRRLMERGFDIGNF